MANTDNIVNIYTHLWLTTKYTSVNRKKPEGLHGRGNVTAATAAYPCSIRAKALIGPLQTGCAPVASTCTASLPGTRGFVEIVT